MLTNRRRQLPVRPFLVLFLPLLIAACGYSMVEQKGIYKGEVVSLDVPMFKNMSLEPHVPLYFTEAFSRELVYSGIFDVNTGSATSVLQGTITTVRSIPTALSTQGVAVQKTVYVDVNLVLMRKDGKVIKNWVLGDAEVYDAEPINLEDFNRREAMKRIAARIARRFSALVLADVDRKMPK